MKPSTTFELSGTIQLPAGQVIQRRAAPRRADRAAHAADRRSATRRSLRSASASTAGRRPASRYVARCASHADRPTRRRRGQVTQLLLTKETYKPFKGIRYITEVSVVCVCVCMCMCVWLSI